MILADGFGAGELGLALSGLVTCFVGLLTFNARGALEEIKRHGERLAAIDTYLARAEGERLPHRVGSLEKVTGEIQGDMREIKGDLRAIRALLEAECRDGTHAHRRSTDPKES